MILDESKCFGGSGIRVWALHELPPTLKPEHLVEDYRLMVDLLSLLSHHLAKSLQDVSPGKFLRKAQFKANLLGKWFIPVDPWGTTQFCHNCLTWVSKNLSEREHVCPNCGESLPRDGNSAKPIERIGAVKLKD